MSKDANCVAAISACTHGVSTWTTASNGRDAQGGGESHLRLRGCRGRGVWHHAGGGHGTRLCPCVERGCTSLALGWCLRGGAHTTGMQREP